MFILWTAETAALGNFSTKYEIQFRKNYEAEIMKQKNGNYIHDLLSNVKIWQ